MGTPNTGEVWFDANGKNYLIIGVSHPIESFTYMLFTDDNAEPDNRIVNKVLIDDGTTVYLDIKDDAFCHLNAQIPYPLVLYANGITSEIRASSIDDFMSRFTARGDTDEKGIA